jgi:O-antigen/teichoic acid export membrane protein
MTLTTLTSVGGHAASVVVNLATVPLALHYLGVELYGIWLVLTSAVAWLAFAKLGVTPSLLNHLAAAEGRADAARAPGLVATAWWLQVAIAGLLTVLLIVIVPALPLGKLINARAGVDLAAVRQAVTILWLGVLLALPLQVAATVFQAKQEGYLAHGWDLLRSVLRLGGTVVAVRLDLGITGLAAAYAFAPLLAGVGSVLHVFGRRHRALAPRLRQVSRQSAAQLLRTGLQFTGLTIGALVISYTDNIVIAQVMGPVHVPPYAVTFMLAQLFIALEMFVLDAAWPAYVEAASRGDGSWVRAMHFRLVRTAFMGAVVAGAALLFMGRPIVRLWAGEAAVPSIALLATMALLLAVQSVQLCYGRLMTALGRVRTNMLLGLANAAINLPASILLARWIGLPGVALGTMVGYLAIGIPLIVIATRSLDALSPRSPAPAVLEPRGVIVQP